MKSTDTPADAMDAASHRFWLALGEDANRVAKRINTKPAFLAQLAFFAKNGGVNPRKPHVSVKRAFEPSASQKKAREIMGANIFGIEEAIRHFGVKPSKIQLAGLSEVPFSEKVLLSCRDTHILVAVFRLSILDINKRAKGVLAPPREYLWYKKKVFAQERGEIGWYLIRKTAVKNSTNKSWDERQALLGKDEEVPNARVMTYAVIGHFKATGERLFENVWVRCSDLLPSGYRVRLGLFSAKGLAFNSCEDDSQSIIIGLAASRVYSRPA